MKRLFAFVLIALAGCTNSGKDTEKPVDNTPVHTLIFMDKSVSVNANQAFIREKYQQALTDIIDRNITKKGDRLEVYFVHENTAKGRALTYTTRSEREVEENANATDREAAETAFTLSLNREKSLLRQRVMQQLDKQNSGRSNQQTDIWASLSVIAKASESGAYTKVYYLSDMVESVKGVGRRDFHRTPPKDNNQADEWAKADAEQLKQYAIGNPDIMMILPFEPNASVRENNPAVTQYWQTLLQELGAASVEEQ